MNNARPADEQAQPFLSANQHQSDGDDLELNLLSNSPARHLTSDRYSSPSERPLQPIKPSTGLVVAALLVTVLGFTINTEATAYFTDVLGWKKPFATLYLTHSSLALPWLCHVTCLRFKARRLPFHLWARDYLAQLRRSIHSTDAGTTTTNRAKGIPGRDPLLDLASSMALITIVLTISGTSWFLSLALTTPADLTAIYNTSTFFAAAFSVPLLREKLSRLTLFAVAVSIAGTVIIAYGDTTSTATATRAVDAKIGTSRLAGNLIACIGAVAFGLYEVLLKKWVAPSSTSPQPSSAPSPLPLTLAASALPGLYTFTTFWFGLLLLHLLNIESLSLPTPEIALWITIAVLSGSVSLTLLVVLVIWTSPIFASFANILSVFTVALADWALFGLRPSLATYVGGGLVVVAFAALGWDSRSTSDTKKY